MAKFIKTIHDRVNFATKKGLTGYHTPEQITEEVHAESMNLWRKYVEQFQKFRVLDVYLRPFQSQEVVQLTNGLGIFESKDFVYVAEGFVPANFAKSQISSTAYGVGSHTHNLTGTQGQFQWIELYTATPTPATVMVKLDGQIIFNGQITNKRTFIQYLYTGQSALTITVSSQSITLVRHSIVVTGNNTEIHLVDDERFSFRAAHPIKTPTATYPIANVLNQSITVLPAGSFSWILLTLFKRPSKPVYAYTISGDRYVYDDANSIDYEWHETMHDVIMERVLSNLGINIRSAEMVQFAQSQRKMEEMKM